MLRRFFGLLSPVGTQARLSILIFHRVTPQPDPLFPGEVDSSAFDAICTWVKRWMNVLPLDQAIGRLAAGDLPERALCITFDDGYADNHDVALPILQRHGLNAAFFIASGFIDGGCMWNDRVVEAMRLCSRTSLVLPEGLVPGVGTLDLSEWELRKRAVDTLLNAMKYLPGGQRLQCADAVVQAAGVVLPDDLMMSTAKVAALAGAGMVVGGHTVNHPILARLDEREALHEMMAGRRAVENMVQRAVTLFAYPNGRPEVDYTGRDVALVGRAGFTAAVSTARGVSGAGADLFQLPRFTPWDQNRLRFGLRLALNYRTAVQTSARPDRARGGGSIAAARDGTPT